MFNLKLISAAIYELPKEGGMHVPGLIIATEPLLAEMDEQPFQQVRNVAHLPGIVGYSIAMPDMHWGYGFGHQICQDNLNTFIKQGYAEGLPDRQLVAAPINSQAGQTYSIGSPSYVPTSFSKDSSGNLTWTS